MWSLPINNQEAHHRAGGRRRHNAEKQAKMWERRYSILRICAKVGRIPYGKNHRRKLAESFGVDLSQIARDLAWVYENLPEGFQGWGLAIKRRGRYPEISWTNPKPLPGMEAIEQIFLSIGDELMQYRHMRFTPEERRSKIKEVLFHHKLLPYFMTGGKIRGYDEILAKGLGVSSATIQKDIKTLIDEHTCKACGTTHVLFSMKELASNPTYDGCTSERCIEVAVRVDEVMRFNQVLDTVFDSFNEADSV